MRGCIVAGMKIYYIILFLSSIVAANLAVTELDPVPVGFGLYAPAGVYLVALALALRDLVQRSSGVLGLVIAGVGGVALSYALADSQVVSASVVAFLVSFTVDTFVFSIVWLLAKDREEYALAWAVLISGLISMVPDTMVFLAMADLEQFIPGQLLGKFYGTVMYAAVLFAIGRFTRTVREGDQLAGRD